jgi:hypothetical protein
MAECPHENCPLRRQCMAPPTEKKEPADKKQPLPPSDGPLPKEEELRKQGVERVRCGGGFRVLRRPRMLDSE